MTRSRLIYEAALRGYEQGYRDALYDFDTAHREKYPGIFSPREIRRIKTVINNVHIADMHRRQA